jgi:hypothetical protein
MKTNYLNEKNELEKALARIHNDGQYVGNLERDLERLRDMFKERVQSNDNNHLSNLRKTCIESNDVVNTAVDTLKIQY